MFIGFGDLVKTLKDKAPATTKTTQRGRADKNGTELWKTKEDMIIIDIFLWLSRFFRPFSRPVIRGCEGLALFEPVLGDLRVFSDNW
jgi:hypothetical protein